MMTVAQLVERFRQTVGYDLDPIFGAYPTSGLTPDIDAWNESVVTFLDEAMVELANLAYLTADNVALTLTAGQGSYPLTSNAFATRVLEPFSVDAYGNKLRNAAWSDYGLWTPAELNRQCPRWYADPSGTPTKAVFFGDRLVLHPAPDANGTAYVEGKIAPPLLTTTAMTTTYPGLPERMHPGIAGLAVYKACKDFAQEQTQFARLASMRDEAFGIAQDVGRKNMEARVGNGSVDRNQVPQRMAM